MSRYIDADKAEITYSSKDMDKVAELFNELLDAQPTADVRENIKVEWINLMGHQVCSICGYKNDIVPTNFCPNCGAQMMRGEA